MQLDKVQYLHYSIFRGANMGELKSLRIERKLTQNQAADILGVSLRSYKSYENDEKKADSIKYKYMLEKISEINPIDEENGIVDIAVSYTHLTLPTKLEV